MKVCTDSCVFGAWAEVREAATILDIGAGTGLLSLMAAQRNPEALIDAVEIEENASAQASDNVRKSPYADRIKVYHAAVQQFEPGYGYDCIISNPPFFQNDLRAPDASVNLAHHAESLHLEDLEKAASRLLKPSGVWYVLLPPAESLRLQHMAGYGGWILKAELLLSHSPGKKPFRRMIGLGRTGADRMDAPAVPQVLSVYGEDGVTYDPGFREMLKEFYLAF